MMIRNSISKSYINLIRLNNNSNSTINTLNNRLSKRFIFTNSKSLLFSIDTQSITTTDIESSTATTTTPTKNIADKNRKKTSEDELLQYETMITVPERLKEYLESNEILNEHEKSDILISFFQEESELPHLFLTESLISIIVESYLEMDKIESAILYFSKNGTTPATRTSNPRSFISITEYYINQGDFESAFKFFSSNLESYHYFIESLSYYKLMNKLTNQCIYNSENILSMVYKFINLYKKNKLSFSDYIVGTSISLLEFISSNTTNKSNNALADKVTGTTLSFNEIYKLYRLSNSNQFSKNQKSILFTNFIKYSIISNDTTLLEGLISEMNEIKLSIPFAPLQSIIKYMFDNKTTSSGQLNKLVSTHLNLISDNNTIAELYVFNQDVDNWNKYGSDNSSSAGVFNKMVELVDKTKSKLIIDDITSIYLQDNNYESAISWFQSIFSIQNSIPSDVSFQSFIDFHKKRNEQNLVSFWRKLKLLYKSEIDSSTQQPSSSFPSSMIESIDSSQQQPSSSSSIIFGQNQYIKNFNYFNSFYSSYDKYLESEFKPLNEEVNQQQQQQQQQNENQNNNNNNNIINILKSKYQSSLFDKERKLYSGKQNLINHEHTTINQSCDIKEILKYLVENLKNLQDGSKMTTATITTSQLLESFEILNSVSQGDSFYSKILKHCNSNQRLLLFNPTIYKKLFSISSGSNDINDSVSLLLDESEFQLNHFNSLTNSIIDILLEDISNFNFASLLFKIRIMDNPNHHTRTLNMPINYFRSFITNYINQQYDSELKNITTIEAAVESEFKIYNDLNNQVLQYLLNQIKSNLILVSPSLKIQLTNLELIDYLKSNEIHKSYLLFNSLLLKQRNQKKAVYDGNTIGLGVIIYFKRMNLSFDQTSSGILSMFGIGNDTTTLTATSKTNVKSFLTYFFRLLSIRSVPSSKMKLYTEKFKSILTNDLLSMVFEDISNSKKQVATFNQKLISLIEK